MADYPDDALEAGVSAPDFELGGSPDEPMSLADFRGAPLIMAFYPADWSPVCGDQMALYNQLLPEFPRCGAALVGLPAAGVGFPLSSGDDRHFHFPLLSDFEPKGEVARRYGVYDDVTGETKRALFVLDGDGVIRWSYV